MIKSTYTLDVGTIRALEALARRWRVSKSEALRRAITAASGEARTTTSDPLAALAQLQKALRLTPPRAASWAARVRAERRGTSSRRLARPR